MKYKNLIILGTSHIAVQSVQDVEKSIEKHNPDIVALELDKPRLAGLLEKEKRMPRLNEIRKVGIKGFIFSIIGAWAEKKLGKQTGVSPGSEMKKAYETASKKGIKVSLIDQDIRITLKRISESMSWKEKWRLFIDAIKALIFRKNIIMFDLKKVPEEKVIKKLTSKVRKRYPNLYKVLVEERNEVMAKNLAGLMSQNPDSLILAVIGAGHEKEMLAIIKQELNSPSVSYSFSYDA